MSTKFSTFLKEIEDEAAQEGPESVEQIETFTAHFRSRRKRFLASREWALNEYAETFRKLAEYDKNK